MVSTSSLCKRPALVISAFKTRRKLQVSKDVIQSVQIINKSNIKTIQESRNKAIHSYVINRYCLINSLSSENQNQALSNKQFNSRVDCKLNKSVFNHTLNRFMKLERTAVVTLSY